MKEILKHITNFYLYSSLHIGFCSVYLYLFTINRFDLQVDLNYLLFVFSSTIFIYSIHRLIGINKVKKFAHKGRFAVIEKFKSHILVYAVLSFILCCYLFLDFEWSRIVIISGAGIISVLYTIPIFGKSMRLRDFSFIKIFLIAIVWAYVTGSVPLYEQGAPMGEIILYFLVVVFFFIAITIPFDIRDFYVDSTNKVLTIPILLGKDRSIKLTFGLLSATVLFDLLLMLYYHPPVIGTISISVTCLIVGLIIYRIRHKESDYYFSGLLDTVIMFPYTIITLIGFF